MNPTLLVQAKYLRGSLRREGRHVGANLIDELLVEIHRLESDAERRAAVAHPVESTTPLTWSEYNRDCAVAAIRAGVNPYGSP